MNQDTSAPKVWSWAEIKQARSNMEHLVADEAARREVMEYLGIASESWPARGSDLRADLNCLTSTQLRERRRSLS